MHTDNPEKEDIQLGDSVWGYVKLYVRLIKDSVEQYTAVTVYQDNFNRLATTLITHLYADVVPEDKVPASLKTLLDLAVVSGTRLAVTRVAAKDKRILTYWAYYVHQPRYEIDYTLYSAQNKMLFEHAFTNNLYYPAPEYNLTYKATVQDCFIKTSGEGEGAEVNRLGLLLVIEDYNYVYRIDTQVPQAIENTLDSLGRAAAIADLDTLDDFKDVIVGRTFLFSVMLDYVESTGFNYETFAFGKEVK
jgi:hypothetical protein